jgi:alpha-beta hydrolase superfamily lysophospholipase
MKNFDRPEKPDNEEGKFHTTRGGIKLYIYEKIPQVKPETSIYIISGITGINHKSEKDIIELLSAGRNRVVVIHPRGTGYSYGARGDIDKFKDFTDDYIEIISSDLKKFPENHQVILYGHSMSCAISLNIALSVPKISGVILVNPPYKMKASKGMTPKFGDYVKYAGYMIFASHTPIVNMAGDPGVIENPDDRKEAEARGRDILLVKYFSMYCMMESRKLMDKMADYAKKADYPLLLIYGMEDKLVEKSGCDEIYSVWKSKNKKYEIVINGSHGKSTVFLSKNTILKWLDELK